MTETDVLNERARLANHKEYDKLTGWKFHSADETPDGKIIEYSFCPIFRSGVSRGRLVGEEGVEKVAYFDDRETMELCNERAKRSLENDLGYSPF